MNITPITNTWARLWGIWSMLIILGLFACEFDPPDNINVSDDVNITGYLNENPEEFSSLSRILQISKTSGYLNAYGTYTFFAPNNDALNRYFSDANLSLESLTESQAIDIVRYHLLSDTLSTSRFTDGKLPVPTQYGKYLVTGAELIDGEASFRVNRQASIIRGNVILGNGVLHVINDVLVPPVLTAAEHLENDPRYSVFTQAMKETGWYNVLNQESPNVWYTVMAESDGVLAEEGFDDYEALRNRLSHTGDPTDPTDSLNLYVAYHILEDIKFIADLLTSTAHATKAPEEVITIRLKGETVLVNEDVFFGVLEEGSPIIRAASDISVTNGVVHSVDKHYAIKLRSPTAVYWDVADQPEIRQMTNVFRVPGAPTYIFRLGELSRMTWGGSGVDSWIRYEPPGLNEIFFVNGDFMRIQVAQNRLNWITITTPVLVRGRYKIWFCYRAIPRGTQSRVLLNGEPIAGARMLDSREYYPGGLTDDDEAEARGWKQYLSVRSNNFPSRLVGIIDVSTTGEQTITLERVAGGTDGYWLDMIHFIPEDMEQQWPKFQRDGSLVYE
ncbi:MAG TPA: fasciclin domain-containing protein [Anditalea sp.]|nr:fasciclin domain-containing protein [Anditalea sp.]